MPAPPRSEARPGGEVDLTDLADLAYELPAHLVARRPPVERDGGRLLVVRPEAHVDARVLDLPDLLLPGDLLVLNDTRVVPARLRTRRASGGAVEVLLLPTTGGGVRRQAMLRPGRRLAPGEVLVVEGGGGEGEGESGEGESGEVHLRERLPDGSWWVEVLPDPDRVMARAGHVPLPPYLEREDDEADRERYQTVFAGPPGAVAAPTAGLHLSRRLLQALQARGVALATVTLHVGPGTFRPLRPEDLARGRLHAEAWTLPQATARAVEQARARGGRVVAVGTTSTRVLETAARDDGTVQAGAGATELFIRPGQPFRVVDRLLTNLHLPGSSLLALVQAFGGRQRLRAAYAHAVASAYRFYSYGDAMLLDLSPPGRPGGEPL